MGAKPHDGLAVSVSAVRELLEETLRSHAADARAARVLSLATDVLDALWIALQGQAADEARWGRDQAELFEFTPAPCVLTDVNGRVRCANRSAAELFGIDASELAHRPMEAFFAPQRGLMPIYLLELMGRGRDPCAMRWCDTVGGPEGGVPVEVSVREAGRNAGRLTGLCWLIRPLGDSPAVTPQIARSAAVPRLDLPIPQTPR
jgi:PAS domain S-box-containing protein